jgi:hypothetical protein
MRTCSALRIILSIVCLLLGFFGRPVGARADVLLDSIGSNLTVLSTTPAYYIHNFPSDDHRTAVALTPSRYYLLDRIDLGVEARFTRQQRLLVSVHRAQAGLPGPALESFLLTGLDVAAHPVVTHTITPLGIESQIRPVLEPGMTYFFSLSTPDNHNFSDFYWYVNNANLGGPVATLSSPLNGTAWRLFPNANLPRIRISATVVPEPTVSPLLALAVVHILVRYPSSARSLGQRNTRLCHPRL